MYNWESHTPIAHEGSGLQLRFDLAKTDETLRWTFPEQEEEFYRLGIEATLLNYSLYRRLRGQCLAGTETTRRAAFDTATLLGVELAQVLLPGNLELLRKKVEGLKVLSEELAAVSQYAHFGGTDFSRTLSNLNRDLQTGSILVWLQTFLLLYKERRFEDQIITNIQTLSHSGRVLRLHFLGPLASGWSYLTFALLNDQAVRDDLKKGATFSPNLDITFSPLVFDRSNKEMYFPIDLVKPGDLLIVVDDVLKEERTNQIRAYLCAHGKSNSTWLFPELAYRSYEETTR